MDKLEKKHVWIILSIIIFIGLELRLMFLQHPFWYDEACSVLIAQNTFPSGINGFLWNQDYQHTPLYFYILHFWIKLFGDAETTLRVLSLIFSFAIMPLSYVVGTKLANKKVGLIALILTCINPFQVIYATEVRMYGLVMLFALLSINYLLDFNKNFDKKSLCKLAVVNVLMPYVFSGGLVFVLAQWIFYGAYLFYKKHSQALLIFLKSIGISMVTLIPYFILIGHYVLVRHTFMMGHTGKLLLNSIFGMFQSYFLPDAGSLYMPNLFPYFINITTVCLIFIPFVFVIKAFIKAFKSGDDMVKLIFAVTIFSATIIFLGVVFQCILLSPRYMIYVAPLGLILFAVGLSDMKNKVIISILTFYIAGSFYYLFANQSIYNLRYNALKVTAERLENYKFNSNDMLIMPFASSVITYYVKGDNAPKVPVFEIIQEVRVPDNRKIYNDYQMDNFKQGYIDTTLQEIVLKEGYLSENYYRTVKGFLNQVQSGGRIMLAFYGPDCELIVPREQYIIPYKELKNVIENRSAAILSKAYNDLNDIIAKNAKLLRVERDNSNLYFLYQKN